MLLLLIVNFVSGSRLELMYILYIHHEKYQVEPHSSSWFSAACAAAIAHRNHVFRLYQKDKSSESKVKFSQASNRCKGFLKLPNLHMLIKQNSPSLPRNFAQDFWQIANSVLTKVNLLCHLYSPVRRCCLLHLIKQNCFSENFSKNADLDDSGISLLVFPWRTNLKLHNISVTPKKVKRVIMNLDFSKASGTDCIPVVVLKNCEPELFYILAVLSNKCVKGSCFPDCWKVSSVVPVFQNVGERAMAKNYRPDSLLSVVSKFFEKLVNSRFVGHLEKCGFFFDFRCGFRSSRSTIDLLTVVSDRIARDLNRSGATQAAALVISEASDRVWHAVFFTNLHNFKSDIWPYSFFSQ